MSQNQSNIILNDCNLQPPHTSLISIPPSYTTALDYAYEGIILFSLISLTYHR